MSIEGETKGRIQLARSSMAQLNKIWANMDVIKQTKIGLFSILAFSNFLIILYVVHQSNGWPPYWCFWDVLIESYADDSRYQRYDICSRFTRNNSFSTSLFYHLLPSSYFFWHINRGQFMETLIVLDKPFGNGQWGPSPNCLVNVTRNLLDPPPPLMAHTFWPR